MGRRRMADLLLALYPRRKEMQLGKKLSYSGGGFLLAALLMLMPGMAFAAVTIGNTNTGIVDSGNSNYLNGSKVTVGATSLQVTSLSVFVGNVDVAPNNQYQLAIYMDANGAPGGLIASSTSGVLTPNAWNTLSLNATLQPNTTYWLMYNTNGRTDSVNNMYYNAGGQGAGSYSTNAVSFGSWPSTFPAVKTTAVYSLYATAGSSVDPTPPTVTITAPQPGTTVSGIVNVSANATDNVGVTSVQFQLDGNNIGGAVTTTPYVASWTTRQATNGSHALTAIARDAAGNQTTSAPVVVTVSNNNPQSQIGEWTPVLAWPLVAIHANLLKTGKVLVWDEENTITHPMLWDPATQILTATGAVGNELWCSGHAQLADGKLFVAGGHLPNVGEVGIKSTYVYDPDANTWSQSSDMAYPRWYPELTKLSDGRIAIFSGQITPGVFADTPEIYNPSNGSLSTLTTITTPELQEEEYPANFYLPGGKVLAISPQFGGVQLFDPVVSTWTRVNNTPIKLGTAVQYRPGKVLMSGGGAALYQFLPAGGQTAVLDMNVTPSTWRPTASMSFGRYMHTLVMLPTGKVLAIGGSSVVDETTVVPGPLPVELWDPNTETWATLAAMAVPRMYHSTALLLPDGRVLAAGGGRNYSAPNQLSAQVYSPPYLFKGSRPTITSAPDNVPYGSAPFTVNSPEAATIASVSLISLGSVTHSTDMNQSYAELPFTKTTNQLVVSAPQDATQISPGYYMLFLVDANGVPSVAKTLKIVAAAPPPSSTTLGLTSKGSILDSGNSNYLNGSKVQTSNGGGIVSMSVYIGNIDTATNSRQYQLAIYNDNAGRPGTLLARTTTSGTLTANAWNTLPLNAALQPNTTYWLMYNSNGRTASVNNMYFNNGTTGEGAFSTANVNFGTWPSTFPAATISKAVFSLYATFGP
jgi:Domain of unknown function (DUF1929)/Bacterial Ig domain/Kelch motif